MPKKLKSGANLAERINEVRDWYSWYKGSRDTPSRRQFGVQIAKRMQSLTADIQRSLGEPRPRTVSPQRLEDPVEQHRQQLESAVARMQVAFHQASADFLSSITGRATPSSERPSNSPNGDDPPEAYA